MIRIIFTLATAMLVGSMFTGSCAEYFYMDDVNVAGSLGGTIQVNVKAHFEASVSAWQVDFGMRNENGEFISNVLPGGLTVKTAAKGSDMTLTYTDDTGGEGTVSPSLQKSYENTRFIVAQMEGNYWDPDGDGEYELQGVAKWGPGEYEQMWKMTFNIPANFTYGKIVIQTRPISGFDNNPEVITTDGGYYYSVCNFTNGAVPVTSIGLDQNSVMMLEGDSLQLKAFILPNDATNKYLLWSSSNTDVATVDSNGLVTAVSPGSTTITAMTTDGSNLSAACTIIVKNWSINQYFVMPDTTVFHGDTIVIPVQLTNEESLLAFQTDICLPEGFTIVTDEEGELLITPSNRLTSDHIIVADQLDDGTVRVICYSPNSSLINGSEGEIFYFSIATPLDAGGDYSISLRNTLLTTSDYNELHISDAVSALHVDTYIPGDVNDNRQVTVTDIVSTVQYIMQRNPSPFVFEAADMNGDGNISVTDIMLIARLIMSPVANASLRYPSILMSDGDYMSGNDIMLAAGETRTVSIMLDNAMEYSAFQLDMILPDGLVASNFKLTDRAESHELDMNTLSDGRVRVLCYSPTLEAINGSSGALLTFDVNVMDNVAGDITIDGIELVTTGWQTVRLNPFTIGVMNANVTSVQNVSVGKTVAKIEYFNLAGQRMTRPTSGLALVVVSYTDGTCSTSKVVF